MRYGTPRIFGHPRRDLAIFPWMIWRLIPRREKTGRPGGTALLGFGGLVGLAGLILAWQISMAGWPLAEAYAFQTARGVLELTVLDPETGQPVPCRIHLRKSKGRPVKPEGVPSGQDHFVCPGQVSLKLPLGTYEFEMERGPEYAVRSGYFTLQRDSNDAKQVELPRFVDMASEGWYAGDLLVARAGTELDLLMEAEGLWLAVHVGPSAQKGVEGRSSGATALGASKQSPSSRQASGADGHRGASAPDAAQPMYRRGLWVENAGGSYVLVPLEGDISDCLPGAGKPEEAARSEKPSAYVPPAKENVSGHLPSAKQPLTGQVPSAKEKLSGQVPSAKENVSGHLPSAKQPLTGQVPSAKEKLSGQVPSAKEDVSGHLPSAKETLSGPGPIRLSEAELLDLLESPGFSGSGGRDRVWMDVVWPYSWDLPLWLALGKVDSVQVLHSHFRRSEWVDEEKEGKPRDKAQFPGRWGHGLWGQYIYFQILECGFRIPPSAGSGAGWTPNPVGYNRLYVYGEGPPTWTSWWEAFGRGQVLVTNGPLLRPSVQGKPPGHEFAAPAGQKVELEMALRFSTRDRVEYLEIIQNGRVAHSIPFTEYQKSGRLPKVVFAESGWFLVRAMAETPPTYRLAMTGPYYVRIGQQERISRSAVRFFLAWLQEREAMVQKSSPWSDPRVRKAYQQARQFWEDLRQRANAD